MKYFSNKTYRRRWTVGWTLIRGGRWRGRPRPVQLRAGCRRCSTLPQCRPRGPWPVGTVFGGTCGELCRTVACSSGGRQSASLCSFVAGAIRSLWAISYCTDRDRRRCRSPFRRCARRQRRVSTVARVSYEQNGTKI